MSGDFDRWFGVGVHPTPDALVNLLAMEVTEFVLGDDPAPDEISLVDLFARDGRLGVAVANRLRERGVRGELAAVDVDPVPSACSERRPHTYITADVFSWQPDDCFQIVVANPPYERLTAERARQLELRWDQVTRAGRNLYGLAILHALDICAPGGTVGFVCPFNWYSAVSMHALRSEIAVRASACSIIALNDRSLFPGLTQDVGVCLFRRRSKHSHVATHWQFRYLGAPTIPALLPASLPRGELGGAYSVTVGAFVWNRAKKQLSRGGRGTARVLYGGNIVDTTLVDAPAKYAHRQFVAKDSLKPNELCRGPAVVMRRVLRGAPGAWTPDIAVVASNIEFVPENHVIVITPKRWAGADLVGLARMLRAELPEVCRTMGSPSISTVAVRSVVNQFEQTLVKAS